MEITELRKLIDNTRYHDAPILDLQILYFGDEVNLFVYEDETSCWKIQFNTCYKVSYETDADWRKIELVKNMKKPQLGYYLQEIQIEDSSELSGYIDVSMDLTIMTVFIICKEILVEKIPVNSIAPFWKNF